MMEMLADLKGISREKIGDEAKKYIKLVGLQDKLDKKVKTLSGGMIRRLGVAQALLGEPDIIIFDEPTAGLDPEERLRFKNIVSKLEGERTIIISTHIVEDVENLCDELVIINNGTVAAQGTCAEIENAAAGKVYEIEDSRLGELSEPYFIQRQFERDSKRMTAVLSAQAQPTAASVSPRVEDGYICITKTYERGFYGCASVAEKCGCGEVCSARALRCSLSDTALLHAFQRHRARDDRGLSAADVAGDISVLLRVGCHFCAQGV